MTSVEIIEALTAEIRKLNEHPIDEFSGDTLSRIGVRLASYKAGLGNYVAEAKADTLRAERVLAEAKANGYQKLRDEGMSQGDAEQLRVTLSGDQYEEWVVSKEIEDRLVGLSYNISNLIDAIKSRLIHLQMELKESSHLS